MKKQIVLLIILSLFSIACNNSGSNKTENKKEIKEKQNKKSEKVEEGTYRLPPLPKNTYDQIFKYGDYLDIIFEDLDFSMSQDNNASIRAFLQNFNIKRTSLIKPSCKPMGHVIFLKNGNSIIEADFYHSPGCYYFLFMYEGDKPMFSNSMSETGINFFENIKKNNFKSAK